MKSFNQTPSPGMLREKFPEIAASMEAIVVKDAAHKLGISFTSKTRKKAISLEIPLSNSHLLVLSSVDIGPGGMAELFSFIKKAKRIDPDRKRITEFEVVETIRVHAQIFEITESGRNLVFSHTLHEENLERVIRCALEGAYQIKNLSLTPIERRSGARKIKIKNSENGETK